ncbi:MAG: D-tyrosyl-tRNA(Tyr) deacylase [Saprospiraceae bacterium]|nr:D-tyrosyl-tRNA(Tyr) deacylase [Saprospiraceae bacterium]
MRIVIQRVREASVRVEGRIVGAIGRGLLVLVGVEEDDERDDVMWLCQKLKTLRIFSDEEGRMNADIAAVGGAFLVVSQFTLHASTRKGNRPSFIRAARPEKAIPLYQYFLEELAMQSGCPVESGIFAADMQVGLVNDGPVTLIMDSKRKE